jgi:hypothetical protein
MATPTRQRYKFCLSLLAGCFLLPIASHSSWAQNIQSTHSATMPSQAKSVAVKSWAVQPAASGTSKPVENSELATPVTPATTVATATAPRLVATAETISLNATVQPAPTAQVKPLFSQTDVSRTKANRQLTKQVSPSPELAVVPTVTSEAPTARQPLAQPTTQPVSPVAAAPVTTAPVSPVSPVAVAPVAPVTERSRDSVQLSAAPLLNTEPTNQATTAEDALPVTGEQELAQNTNPALSDLLIPALPPSIVTTTGRIGAPASSISTPIAFGARSGQAYTSVGYQAQTRGVPGPNTSGRSDGGFGFGFGIGDPSESVALEVGVTSVSTLRRGPFVGGTVSLKLHHMLENDLGVAVGVENLVTWGVNDGGTSVYGVVTKHFQLSETPTAMFSSVTVSAGVGSGRFRSIDDIRSGDGSVNLFGSVGVRVAEPVSFIADWSGQDLGLGLSISPFRDIPLTITPAIVDITGNSNSDARFVIGVGYGINF